VGTVAAYGRTGDYYTFYEINPEVKRQAETYFTYLGRCKAKVDVILGDARLSLERQEPQDFDLLVLDAFTSDAIPVHLLTEEAFGIYLQHLKPDGVIALHISTIHVDLQSVVRRLAEHLGLSVAWIEAYRRESEGVFDSDWLILTGHEEFINHNAVRSRKSEFEKPIEDIDLWTDDHVNLLEVLK
jgi:spermidine synthase